MTRIFTPHGATDTLTAGTDQPINAVIDKHVADHGTTDDGYLFQGRRHRHVTRRTCNENFERAAAKAGLPPEFIPHTLRHCYDSTARACGSPRPPQGRE